MANTGSVVVSLLALVFGLALGAGGLFLMLEAGSFASADAESHSGPLGLWGNASQEASVNTPAWIGLLVAVFGGGLALFGFQALFASVDKTGRA